MKLDFTRYAPPGIPLKQEGRFFAAGLSCAALYSFGFLVRYSSARSDLYVMRGGKRVLDTGVRMEDFAVLLDGALLGFLVLGLCMLAVIAYHYAYYHQGSKPIYLMRRLPDGGLLHRQCLTLPLGAVGLCLLSAMVVLLLYYVLYMTATPEVCLTAGQWQKLWRVFP